MKKSIDSSTGAGTWESGAAETMSDRSELAFHDLMVPNIFPCVCQRCGMNLATFHAAAHAVMTVYSRTATSALNDSDCDGRSASAGRGTGRIPPCRRPGGWPGWL